MKIIKVLALGITLTATLHTSPAQESLTSTPQTTPASGPTTLATQPATPETYEQIKKKYLGVPLLYSGLRLIYKPSQEKYWHRAKVASAQQDNALLNAVVSIGFKKSWWDHHPKTAILAPPAILMASSAFMYCMVRIGRR
jgi:hypothetical protein